MVNIITTFDQVITFTTVKDILSTSRYNVIITSTTAKFFLSFGTNYLVITCSSVSDSPNTFDTAASTTCMPGVVAEL